jgi:hypothetical protein
VNGLIERQRLINFAYLLKEVYVGFSCQADAEDNIDVSMFHHGRIRTCLLSLTLVGRPTFVPVLLAILGHSYLTCSIIPKVHSLVVFPSSHWSLLSNNSS